MKKRTIVFYLASNPDKSKPTIDLLYEIATKTGKLLVNLLPGSIRATWLLLPLEARNEVKIDADALNVMDLRSKYSMATGPYVIHYPENTPKLQPVHVEALLQTHYKRGTLATFLNSCKCGHIGD